MSFVAPFPFKSPKSFQIHFLHILEITYKISSDFEETTVVVRFPIFGTTVVKKLSAV